MKNYMKKVMYATLIAFNGNSTNKISHNEKNEFAKKAINQIKNGKDINHYSKIGQEIIQQYVQDNNLQLNYKTNKKK